MWPRTNRDTMAAPSRIIELFDVTSGGMRMRVFVGFVALAFMLSFPAIDARAQSPAADLYVVVLTTVANTAQRPATPLPEGLRDKSVYWRRVKLGDAVSYQLALGFFVARSDAERAQQQLAARFREARVYSVSLAERENVLKAQVPAVTPAPLAQEISLALPPPIPAPPVQEITPPVSRLVAPTRGNRPELRIKLGGAAGISKAEVTNIGNVDVTQDAGGNVQVEVAMTLRSDSGVALVGSAGLFSRQHNGHVNDPVLPTDIKYDAGGVSGSIGASFRASENLHFEGRLELGIGSGKPTLTTPGFVWNDVRYGGYSSASLIFGGYYTFAKPGLQIGLELGSQSFVGNFQIWNNGGFWSNAKVEGGGAIGNFIVGVHF
jgi:hypothetical protein